MEQQPEIRCYECSMKETSRIHQEGHEHYHQFKPPLNSENIFEHLQYLRKPTPYQLWKEAGRNPQKYLELMRASGHITPGKDDAHFAILCTGRRGSYFPRCACGNVSDRRCNAKLANSKTCDVRLCRSCGIRVGRDSDYCKARHREQAQSHAAELRRLHAEEQRA